VQQDLPTWQKLGHQLALQLGFDHDSMDDTQRYVAQQEIITTQQFRILCLSAQNLQELLS
jgi:hypothetical protein